MDAAQYREQALAGATGVDLIVALYDGAIRFTHRAAQCVREGDVPERRIAVKKATDIIMYLQARLRPDVGGKTAQALGEFYAAMFTMMLEASHHESEEEFAEVVLCLRNVRDAWSTVAADPQANRALPRELRTAQERLPRHSPRAAIAAPAAALRWSA